MAAKKAVTYVQFSKRLAFFVSLFWALSRIATSVLLALFPDMAASFLELQTGADNIMLFSLGCYSGNSVAEKGIVNFFKAKTSTAESDDTQVG